VGSGWAATVIRQRIRGLELSASKDQRTAKWTAITGGLAGTHGHNNALNSQVGATAALARRLLDLHGMQEVRGSNPLSYTFPQFKGMFLSLLSLLIFRSYL